ncbi:hypothetical protein B0H11DRAFT_2231993 [Mycena galericulata]|nr:hypothetical protein B0H11DRAFT_2231993 [Mycena galericulata]
MCRISKNVPPFSFQCACRVSYILPSTAAKTGRKKTPTAKGKGPPAGNGDSDLDDDDLDGDPKAVDKTLALETGTSTPPGPNASTAKGGGKTKTESQWQLCLNLLVEDPKYQEALDTVKTKKEQVAYANKIKNRLRTMAKLTRNYMTEMGETGTGIRSAAEIDTNVTTRWRTGDIQDLPVVLRRARTHCAASQDPNLVPTGLGHSGSGIDDDVLGAAPTASPVDDLVSSPGEFMLQDDTPSDGEVVGHTASNCVEF